MRLLHADKHTESIGHHGEQFERDEHGAFELPHELAVKLLEGFPHLWSVAPEPVPAEAAEPVKRGRTSKPKPEPAQSPDEGSDAPGPDGDNDQPVTEEGDGDDAPAPEAPKGRASSRKASA